MSLGFVVLASLELRDVAFPFLEELARMTDQNVNLGIADKTEVVYIERIKRRRILNIDNYVGSRLSIYRSSIGLALLAFMGESEFQHSLEEILKEAKGAPHVGSKGELLIERIEEVRKCGYAVNNEELMTGLRAIAAPVFDRRGRAEGAINLPVFSIEVSMEDLIDRYLPLLLETAEKISTARGFTKPRDSQTAKGSEE
jgi:IclR family pca regulon transcriptional regulator